jgi:predicted ATP-grasp superfamily ATP-dependent carboligase
LERIRYTGLVEIEYMLDKRDGVYKMLDVNTRVWGWIAMCAYAGVDFPYLMWKLSQGEAVEEVKGRGGVGWSRTMFDIAAMFELIASRSGISPFYFIGTLFRAKHEMYISDDLRPAFMEVFQLFVRAYRKILKILGLYKP